METLRRGWVSWIAPAIGLIGTASRIFDLLRRLSSLRGWQMITLGEFFSGWSGALMLVGGIGTVTYFLQRKALRHGIGATEKRLRHISSAHICWKPRPDGSGKRATRVDVTLSPRFTTAPEYLTISLCEFGDKDAMPWGVLGSIKMTSNGFSFTVPERDERRLDALLDAVDAGKAVVLSCDMNGRGYRHDDMHVGVIVGLMKEEKTGQ